MFYIVIGVLMIFCGSVRAVNIGMDFITGLLILVGLGIACIPEWKKSKA